MVSRKINPLVVIVGQTASGKTDFAIKLALEINGEIICADSRTIYREMNIGTAKPSTIDQLKVKHHLIDIVNPDETFSVYEFKTIANKIIKEIRSRGKQPIVVGGSGLYINALIYDYEFRNTYNENQTQGLSIEEMQAKILDLGLELPENIKNPRYLSRILETGQNSPLNDDILDDTIVVGLNIPKEQLIANITKRTKKMIDLGLIDEYKFLIKKYGINQKSFQIPSYLGLSGLINNQEDLQKSIQNIIKNDLKLAKKQATWFNRNKSIHWLDDPSEYVAITTTLLNKLISSR